ncbi:MAG: serine hydrolase [Gammaproteobacteria bacterium]|nr:serine hydrolase [Gammaproteobacteria bacterium]
MQYLRLMVLRISVCFSVTFFSSFSAYASDATVDKLSISSKIEQLELKQMSSVLVQHKNKLVFEQYYNGTKRHDLHDIRSASKSITSLMLGIAIEQGKIPSLDSKVRPYFKDYEPVLFDSPAKQNMTFFELLSMTNPLECDDWNNFSSGHEERMYLQADWIQFVLNLPERGPAPWEPRDADQKYGRDFSYCTAGISLTAAAIERAVDKGFDDYAHEHLFNPLGIKQVQWAYSPKGITQGGGGLRIKPIDFLKLGQLMLNKGQWNNQSIVPKQWVDKSLTRYSVSMPDMNAEYGLTWWVFDFEVADFEITDFEKVGKNTEQKQATPQKVSAFAAAGNGGNYLFFVPEQELAVVITSTAYNTPYMHQQAHQIFSQVVLPSIL